VDATLRTMWTTDSEVVVGRERQRLAGCGLVSSFRVFPGVIFPKKGYMKKLSFPIVLFCVAVQPLLHAQSAAPVAPAASSTNLFVAKRDEMSRVWAKTITVTNRQGQAITRTNAAYTELATGIAYQDETGTWQDSSAAIDLTPDGAEATHGNHKIKWHVKGVNP